MILKSEKLLAIIIFIISAVLYYDNSNLDCIKYDPLGSRFFPQIACIFLMILSILLYIKSGKRIDIKNNISLLKVKQKFNYQYTEDIPGEIGKEFHQIGLDKKIRPGMKIATTSGSRGINYITEILRSI